MLPNINQNMIGMIMNRNPQMKQVMDYIQSNGGDAKAAFYKKAQEMGVDPEEVLKQCAMLNNNQ